MKTARGTRYVAAALVAVLGVAAAPGAAQAKPGDGWRMIERKTTGLVLGISGSSDANGGKVIQWTKDIVGPDKQAAPNQDWLIVDRGNGYISLRNAGTPDWKAMGVSGGRTDNGAPIIQWTYDTSNHDQQWKRVYLPNDTGFFQLKNRKSGKCLAIPGDSPNKGVQAIQYTCITYQLDQLWQWEDR
ncbi:RICIN domain-containing protein [Actinoplanes sp. NBC_00393]|uniref:RICIN domain-containing protein n=1 Tax=Actinoplanes sp. NBC_00393 TaxID=2975953 RepID=UPI002E23BB62